MAGKAKSTAAPPPEVLTQVPEWASTTAIAQLIGRSTRRVQQLTQDGVLSTEVPPGGGARRYRTARTIQDYMAWQEQKIREELSGSTLPNLKSLTIKKLQAEVELKESQGALHKLKTAIAEGKYLSAVTIPDGGVGALAQGPDGRAVYHTTLAQRCIGRDGVDIQAQVDALTARVTGLVSYQQAQEVEMQAAATLEALEAIPVDYDSVPLPGGETA